MTGMTIALPSHGQLPPQALGGGMAFKGGRSANDPINPALIAIALVYLAWSYFHLSSSIWARLALASLLIIRMRPDIIIPYCLTCLQLRLHLFAKAAGGNDPDGLADVFEGLTGFESYAFSIPPVLMMVMTVLAFVGVRKDRRQFPNRLFWLWAVGSFFVLAGAVTSMGGGRGWTGSIRIYSVVGSCFYGMLMPTLDQRQMTRLAGGLAFLGTAMCVLSLCFGFMTHVLFMLMPLVAVWCVSGLLAGPRRGLSAITMAITGSLCLFMMTFMTALTWLWAAAAGIIEYFGKPVRGRPARGMAWLVGGTAIACVLLFYVGVTQKITEKQAVDDSVLARLQFKIFSDRGPVWSGGLRLVTEEPTWLAIPERPFIVHWFDEEVLWVAGTHNLELDLLRQLGWVAGPIAALVLAYVAWSLVIVIQNDESRGSRALATAAICCIVVGGLTLPYIVRDRVGETMLMSAGLVIASQRARASAERVARSTAAHAARWAGPRVA